MKKYSIVFLLSILLTLLGCESQEQDLIDKIEVEVRTVSEEDIAKLKEIDTIDKSMYKDYSILSFSYEILNSEKFKSTSVEHKFHWNYLFNEIVNDSGLNYITSESGIDFDKNRNYKNEFYKFIFYSKDISNDKLYDIFTNYLLVVKWEDKNGGKFKKEINLADQINFVY